MGFDRVLTQPCLLERLLKAIQDWLVRELYRVDPLLIRLGMVSFRHATSLLQLRRSSPVSAGCQDEFAILVFFHGQFDGGCQVIIADTGRHTFKEVERLHMGIQKTLLILRGKRHDKRSPRVAEPHHKILYSLTDATDDRDSLTPINLCILALIVFQGKKEFWRLVCMPIRAN